MTQHRPHQPGASGRFDAVTITLHWATLVLIVGMFATGWLIGAASSSAQEHLLLAIHRSLGVTVWAVTAGRLAWRLGSAVTPPLPTTMSKVQRALARLNEYGLYALLLIQPLTGLAQSLTRGRPFPVFGWDAPAVMARDKALTHLFGDIHEISAWALLGLIGLHALAAVFHRVILGDEVLQSMLPWKPAGKSIGGEE